jgi:hypothetical protein
MSASGQRYVDQLVRRLTPSKTDFATPRVDTADGARYAVHLLFMAISEFHGKEAAYHVFSKYSGPPAASRVAHIKNCGLLDRLDMMKPKPNVELLARQLAEENKKLPREEQRGAGGIDPFDLARHIREIMRKRKKHPWRYPVA